MKKSAILVPFFVVIAIALVSFAVASEAAMPNSIETEFNGLDLGTHSGVVRDVGETAQVRVTFKAAEDLSDVRVKAYIEGYRDDVSDSTSRFDIVSGGVYTKLLTLELPSDADELTEDYTLYVEVVSSTFKSEESYDLTIQRESYTLEILSVDYDPKVSAGDNVPVTVVAKNNGYNDADDNYVVVSVPELGVSSRGYLGDLVAIEGEVSRSVSTMSTLRGDVNGDDKVTSADRDMITDYILTGMGLSSEQIKLADANGDGFVDQADLTYISSVILGSREAKVYREYYTFRESDSDEEDAVEKTVYLNLPENAEAGVYELLVEVYNEDASVVTKRLISVSDSGSVMVLTGVNSKDLKAGESVTFDLVIVNSADSIRVLDVSAFSGNDLNVFVPSVVTVGPDSSETISVEVSTDSDVKEGVYTFTVDVDGKQVTFNANVVETSSTSILALTVILAIVFVVLLIVLIVLLTRKEKTVEEVETSYY